MNEQARTLFDEAAAEIEQDPERLDLLENAAQVAETHADEEMDEALTQAEQRHERADRADTIRFLLRKALRALKLLPEREG